MSKIIQGNPWVWVVVQDPGGDEQFLGQHDEETDVSFIHIFLEKEDASQGINHLIRDEKKRYEVQAIQYKHLERDASENGFMLFILNNEGKILEKIMP